jgi:hypothetical protein
MYLCYKEIKVLRGYCQLRGQTRTLHTYAAVSHLLTYLFVYGWYSDTGNRSSDQKITNEWTKKAGVVA